MASSLTHVVLHIVFSTKDRLELITPELKAKLYPYIGGIIRGEKGNLIAIGGIADHAHLLVQIPATISIADLLMRVKGNSSHWVGEQPWFQLPFGWQRGYAAFSVSESLVERVAGYIRTQEEHHRKVGFRDELLSLLDKHGVEYDEKYLWA